ncbi:AAA family ATPase [Rhizobium leguminosarum]|nr:AAA family ATPase [Rhizobium ruizarguesonis]
MRAINATARHFGMKVYLLAVAGRAASRMSALTGQPAQTIASWLRGAADDKIEVGRRTLIIIDGASMLDLPTLYRILFFLPDDAPLLLVGDTAQLPPIDSGSRFIGWFWKMQCRRSSLRRYFGLPRRQAFHRSRSRSRSGKDVLRLSPNIPLARRAAPSSAPIHQMLDRLEDVLHDLASEEVQIVGATYGGSAGR